MNAYIVNAFRSPVGKAPRGQFRFIRPDDLAAQVIKHLLEDIPEIPHKKIDDVIVGNAFPEAEQGFNIGRIISLLGLDTITVPGMTINRYCSSGLESIAIASAKIHSGMADIIIAGGAETMSLLPFGGWRLTPNYKIAKENVDWYWSMGLTAEAVAEKYNISREDQDLFGFNSHQKALHAIKNGLFKDQIVPISVEHIDFKNGKRHQHSYTAELDEGPRESTVEKMAALKPVFANGGTVTAGNASQTSDGAGFVLVVSEKALKEYNLTPIAQLKSYHAAALEPKHMGMGPVYAIPPALKKAGLNQKDINLIELNEAFASQSLAIIRELDLNPEIINVNGGAIALGHPLGATGAKLTVQILHELKRRKQKYGMVTMCVGTGQGAAGVFEYFH
ncbi:MAG: acetyl-CoA C-acyltransferase [Bacteroidales bacterium]|nr:acetyl-CoA C-acyltransferase [Bacteroidales bacterium]